MTKFFRKIMQDQVQTDLDNPHQLLHKPVPQGGWIQIIRKILGMSGQQLAKRLGCSQANVNALERRERQKTITLEALEEAARALNCRLVYAFIPQKPFRALLEEQAKKIAHKRLKGVSHSMKLEKQGLTLKQQKQQEEELVQELLNGNLRELWEDDREI